MRVPSDEDAPLIAELLSRDAPEPVAVDFVLRELHSPSVDLERDARVSDRAAATVEPEGERAWLQIAGDVTPELLTWAEERARETGAKRVLTGTWEIGGPTARLLERSGYVAKGFSIRMRIDLDGRVFAPRLPDGIVVRTYRDGDAERVHRTNVETFADMSEPSGDNFAEWSHWMLQPPLFQPDLWFLAEDGDELVGIALCYPHPTADAGCVGILGVRRPWRGRGLGRALLEHAFAAFAARGFAAVILGAEAASPTGADRLYERAGMRVTHRRARYERVLA